MKKLQLTFIDQPDGQIKDKAVKRKIRRHAMQHAVLNSGNGNSEEKRRGAVREVRLDVPEGFGGGGQDDKMDEDMNKPISGGLDGVHAATRHILEVLLGMDERAFEERYMSRNGRGAAKRKIGLSCVGCRAQGIKGDETKPACLNSHGRCLGYPPHKTFKYSAAQVIALNSLVSTTNITPQPSITLPFNNNLSSLYFGTFMSETSQELTGIFPSSFWNQIILQECHQQDYVQPALVAIAALSKYMKARHLAAISPHSKTDILKQATQHRTDALHHYGISVNLMKKIPFGTSRSTLRSILIASLLVFVFETFYGQPDVALSHHLIADRLICHWLLTCGIKPSGISSPEPHIVEHDLLLTYCRVDLHMMTFTDQRSFAIHQLGKHNGTETIAKMPTLFQNLTDAKLYCELIMRRAYHYTLASFTESQAMKLQRDFSIAISIPKRVIDLTSGTSIYSSPYLTTPSLLRESESYINELKSWSSAFEPLYNAITTTPGTASKAKAAAMQLRMYMLATEIVVSGTTFTSETSYDKFLPSFREIVTLARQLSYPCNSEPSFRLELSIASPLYTVLLRCRDGGVRREALKVLRVSNQRDGPWDREMMGRATEWVIGVEEKGRDGNGFIREEDRVRLSRVCIDMERKRLALLCVRRIGDEGLMWEEVVIEG